MNFMINLNQKQFYENINLILAHENATLDYNAGFISTIRNKTNILMIGHAICQSTLGGLAGKFYLTPNSYQSKNVGPVGYVGNCEIVNVNTPTEHELWGAIIETGTRRIEFDYSYNITAGNLYIINFHFQYEI